jgi:hypothetical protein
VLLYNNSPRTVHADATFCIVGSNLRPLRVRLRDGATAHIQMKLDATTEFPAMGRSGQGPHTLVAHTSELLQVVSATGVLRVQVTIGQESVLTERPRTRVESGRVRTVPQPRTTDRPQRRLVLHSGDSVRRIAGISLLSNPGLDGK